MCRELGSLSSGLTTLIVTIESLLVLPIEKLDGVSFYQCSIKRNDQVNSSASIKVGVTVEHKPITINPSVLFNQLTMLIKQEEKRMEMLKYELMPQPAAHFKDG